MPPLLSVCYKVWGSPSVLHPEAPSDHHQVLLANRGGSPELLPVLKTAESPLIGGTENLQANHSMDAEVAKAKLLGFGSYSPGQCRPQP